MKKTVIILTVTLSLVGFLDQASQASLHSSSTDLNVIELQTKGEKLDVGDQVSIFTIGFREVAENSIGGGALLPRKELRSKGYVVKVLNDKKVQVQLDSHIPGNKEIFFEKIM